MKTVFLFLNKSLFYRSLFKKYDLSKFDKLFLADDKRLEPYRTLPHAALAYKILKEEEIKNILNN